MEVDKEVIEKMTENFKSVVDEAMEKNLKDVAGPIVADKVTEFVKQMRLERALYGEDRTGLSSDQKIAFVKDIQSIATGKAALLEDQDTTGGYLVPAEVHAGIMRIASSVGIVARDARRFPMGSDKLDVPRYTAGDLLGDYIGEDEEGVETDVTFGDAKLLAQVWQVVIRIGRTLLADANVDLADWLLGLIAEGMAARLDKEGFQGGTFVGSPWVGILGSDDVTTFTLATGDVDFSDFDLDDASDIIAQVQESILADCAFYMHRTVWAKVRQKKDTAGNYVMGQNNSMIAANFKKDGIKMAGVMWDFPVFTSDFLPANSASAVSTDFLVFGSMKHGLYFGDRQRTEVARSEHATVGGKSLFLANQTALRVQSRHALAIGLPAALVKVKTAAS